MASNAEDFDPFLDDESWTDDFIRGFTIDAVGGRLEHQDESDCDLSDYEETTLLEIGRIDPSDGDPPVGDGEQL